MILSTEGFFFKEPTLAEKKAARKRDYSKGNSSKPKKKRAASGSTKTVDQKLKDNPCEVCGLYKKGCESPFMQYTGEGRTKALIIGEAPGAAEDAKWKKLGYDVPTQFIGDAGQLLRKELRLLGYNLDKDFWKVNACNCRPPGNATPTTKQLKACWNFIVEPTIKKLKPKVIFLMGGAAVAQYFAKISGSKNVLGINRWRRLCIPDLDYDVWVVPLFHPSFILRKRNDANLKSVYQRDLKFAISAISKPKIERIDYESKVEIVKDFDRVCEVLIEARKQKFIVFDFETSGKKPYDSKHRIWSMSLAWNREKAYSFAYQYPGCWTDEQLKTIQILVAELLNDENVLKGAHNLKFEHLWSCKFFTEPKNWIWCTMLTAHILDNRGGISGLKFQVFYRYGIPDYGASLHQLMIKKDQNGLNLLYKADLDELLLYGGLDSLFTFMLFEDQKLELRRYKNTLNMAHPFFHKGILALARAEMNGFNVSMDFYEEKDGELADQIAEIEHRLVNGDYGSKFREIEGKDINPRSTSDIKKLFFDILNMKPLRMTDKGNPALDKSCMEEWNLPFTNDILQLRMLEKIKGTYLAQFKREVNEDGRIHPNFNLHIPRTYRSSSNEPNFQNIPVRSKLAKEVTRGGIIPSPGNRLMEGDFGSLEVRISACYHKDPNMLTYINDPTTDMHRDSAADIWLLETDEVSKDIRFYAKNGWVFPQFYGDWYDSCARGLWGNCLELQTERNISLYDHIRSKGIKNLEDFIAHCKDVEDKFWNVRFKVYKKWKDKINKQYRDQGYIETYFGFRLGGYMGKKDVTNYPIQSSAFHCLLWSFIRADEIARKERWKSKLIGQIHDSIIADLHPDETYHVIDTLNNIMNVQMREELPWIIVPLEVDFELTGIDQPWSTKDDFDLSQLSIKKEEEEMML